MLTGPFPQTHFQVHPPLLVIGLIPDFLIRGDGDQVIQAGEGRIVAPEQDVCPARSEIRLKGILGILILIYERLKCFDGLLMPFTLKVRKADFVSGQLYLRGVREKMDESLVFPDGPVILAFFKILFGELKLAFWVE
jgi:hypothetical protein